MNKIRGDAYEIETIDYIINILNKPAYKWDECPESILIKNGIIGSHNQNRLNRKNDKENPLPDTGVDVIQIEDDDDTCSLVQCKNGYKNGITMKDLAGFMCWIASLDKLKGYVYYTDKLSHNIMSLPKNDRITFIKLPFIENEIKVNFNDKCFLVDNEKLVYQNKAKDLAIQHYANSKRGILPLPCGIGKTYTSYLISRYYNQIIIISPLKQFAKQNLDKFIEYGYEHKYLLVDSDGERDLDEIKKFIEGNNSFLISTTYDSVDVIYQSLGYMFEPFFIVDEFHNLSKANVTNQDDYFNKLLNSDHKMLFLSATPRIYELENEDDNLNETLFGQTIYTMTFNQAIISKYICDYKIYLPCIHEDNSQLNKELSVYDIDETIKAKCTFLLSCMLNYGSKKCIIYCVDTTELNLMKNAIKKLDEYYYMNYDISQITSDDNLKKRTKILNDFAKIKNIQLLFSIRILDECIDVPSCDSIFITYASKSKIRTLQRICRAVRLDKMNKFKIGKIYLWCSEYDKILQTLASIKEYDQRFIDKIKINYMNHYNDSDIKIYKNDLELIKKYVVGIKEYRQITWNENLELLKHYIDINGKKPSMYDENIQIIKLSQWTSTQSIHFHNNAFIMSNEITRKAWNDFITDERYKMHFVCKKHKWLKTLESVKVYIQNHDKLPQRQDEDENEKKLEKWIYKQKMNFQNKSKIMATNEDIYNIWKKFTVDFNHVFITKEKEWNNNLIILKEYIRKYHRRPTSCDKNNNIKKIAIWTSRQMYIYNNKEQIMAHNNELYDLWTKFMVDFNEYFLSNEEIWMQNFEKLKKYLQDNNQRPKGNDKNNDNNKLSDWFYLQIINYKKKINIMTIENIRNLWFNFINDDFYATFFVSKEDKWKKNLTILKNFIDENHKRPTDKDCNNEIKTLSRWVNSQIKNYKKKKKSMSNKDIYNLWNNFIHDELYAKYFKNFTVDNKKLVNEDHSFQRSNYFDIVDDIDQQLTKHFEIEKIIKKTEEDYKKFLQLHK